MDFSTMYDCSGMNSFNGAISFFRVLSCFAAVVIPRRLCACSSGVCLLFLLSVTLSSKTSITWDSVGKLKIFGGARVLSMMSSDAKFA